MPGMSPKQIAEIRDRKVPHGPNAVSTLTADRDALLAEVERLHAPVGHDELRGLESLCAALHGATESDLVVKDVAWRTFALIRAHRERKAEVESLKTEAAKATRWETHLAETLHYAQLNEGSLSVEVERLTAERARVREILATMRTGKPADVAAGIGRIAAIVDGGETP